MNLKIEKLKRLSQRELMQLANHVFFITAFLFVAHQNTLHPEPVRTEVPMIAQALHFQPRTPPPAYDADQLTNDEVDWSIRPERFDPALRITLIPLAE